MNHEFLCIDDLSKATEGNYVNSHVYLGDLFVVNELPATIFGYITLINILPILNRELFFEMNEISYRLLT